MCVCARARAHARVFVCFCLCMYVFPVFIRSCRYRDQGQGFRECCVVVAVSHYRICVVNLMNDALAHSFRKSPIYLIVSLHFSSNPPASSSLHPFLCVRRPWVPRKLSVIFSIQAKIVLLGLSRVLQVCVNTTYVYI